MKHRIIALLMAAISGIIVASAYDIKVDGIYYNIIDGAYLEVTGMEDYDVEFPSVLLETPPMKKVIMDLKDPLPENDYAGDIVIPESVYVETLGRDLPVKAIRKTAFYGALALESVTLPSTIHAVGEGAFARSGIKRLDMGQCALEKIANNLCMRAASLEEIVYPQGICYIGDEAFKGCNFTTMKFPESVTQVGELAFYGCENLTEFDGHNIKVFYNWAFCYTKLERVILYDSFFYTRFHIFDHIETLKEVISYKLDPDDLFVNSYIRSMFPYDKKDVLILWVPDESLEAYKVSQKWNDYFTDIRPLSERTLEPEVAADAVAKTVEYYDLQGRFVVNPGAGLYIRKSISAGGSVTTEKVQMCK